MARRILAIATLGVWGVTCSWADFRYEQSTKLTGGLARGMMKFAGAFSKKAREPIRTSVLVKGDRMANVTGDTAQVIDLETETITDINFEKKTYSVVSFAQMAQVLEQAADKLKSQKEAEKVDVNFKVSLKDTGQTRQIAGKDTRQMVLTMEMAGTDTSSGREGSMVVTAEMWLGPKLAGYEEVSRFNQRMAQKLAWRPGSDMFAAGSSDIVKGMAEVSKEAAKLEGVPVLQVIKMGAKVEGGERPSDQPAAQRTEPEKPSITGALGGLRGLGGLGGFRRKKKAESQQPEEKPSEQRETATSDSAGLLLEMTTELAGFSAAPVDASKFEVPAGFRQVESGNVKALRK